MNHAANIDLHCHSTASDGLLAPRDLVARARANGVAVLALTDHDEVAGLAEARLAAKEYGVSLVNGVEVSVSWGGITVHIVGLGIDPADPRLMAGLASVRSNRLARARRMAESLDAAGIGGSLEGALAYVANPNLISRTHFARFLVEKGYAPDVHSVFQRYLVSGRPGYVPHQWATLADAVTWIRAGGGVAVVAHPGRYKLSGEEMRTLLAEFKALGGIGIEVLTGNHSPQQASEYARLAREFDLLASRGSDFHGPGESRVDLGTMPRFGADVKPLWRDWPDPKSQTG
ncbi:MAG: PHP domain-containing protein [Betaproteobacteria bacterium]|nr:PHP domain-containing protein [Betaproteobacteria bacterium]